LFIYITTNFARTHIHARTHVRKHAHTHVCTQCSKRSGS